MADLPLFPFTTQEDWYGELAFLSADAGQEAISLEGRTFEMPITPAGQGGSLIDPVKTLTMETGGGISLKTGAPNTLVFRVPRDVARGFARSEYTADVLEVVSGERHLFMPVRIRYSEPSGILSFISRFVGVSVSFSARLQPIISPVAITGRQGAPGATIITGTVPPVPADGKNGDFWIEDRTASNLSRRMYGPKAGGAWPAAPWNIQVSRIADIPGLNDALYYTRSSNAPSSYGALRSTLEDEGRWVDEFGPVDTAENTVATFRRAFALYAARGGGVLKLRRRVYLLNERIHCAISNFHIEGCGGFEFPFPDANPGDTSRYGSVLRWAGPSGADQVMLVVAPVAGPNAKPLTRVQVTGIGLDGNYNNGGTGILVGSVNNSTIEVNGLNWQTVVADFIGITQLAPGYSSDIQVCNIRVGGYQVSSGLIARFDGDPTHTTAGNFCKNNVFLYGSYKYHDAVHVKNCDTNIFEAYIDRFGAGQGETLTSRGLVLFGGGTKYNDFCRSNNFFGLWGGGGVYALGNESGYTVPAGFAAGGALGDNLIEVDVNNGDPYPVIETGARLLVSGLAGDREFGVTKAKGRRSGPPSGVNDDNAVLIAESGLGGQFEVGQYADFANHYALWAQAKSKNNDGSLPDWVLNPLGGNVKISVGNWQYGHALIGLAHLWLDDAGNLRLKLAPPQHANDGGIIGVNLGTAAAANLEDLLPRAILGLPRDPTTGDIPTGTIRVVKNTAANRISLWVNDGGAMVDLLTFNPG